VGEPARHDLVWLRPRWRAHLRGHLPPGAADQVDEWCARGRPLVARRRGPSEPPDVVPLGVALPLRCGRTRIALAVEPAAVDRAAPPLRLAAALTSAPPAWRPALSALDQAARAVGSSLGVYGSLAWQHLSGEPCLHDGSDVDLLATPRSSLELERVLALLRARALDESPRLDGEVVLEDGRAVAWRELLAPLRQVLVKSADAVAIVSRAEVLASLEPSP